MRGCWVYMLLCQDDGPIYGKVGVSDNPEKRLQSIRINCGVTPRQFYSFEAPTKFRAFKIEASLLAALAPWRVAGEWFKVQPEEKAELNAALRIAVEPFTSDRWPCKWERISMARLEAIWQRRKDYWRKRYKERGQAYRDFTRDLR